MRIAVIEKDWILSINDIFLWVPSTLALLQCLQRIHIKLVEYIQ